jgi:hypothetical protein
MDYLHCSLSFHSKKRYDAVIIKTQSGHFFGRLEALFTCVVNNSIYPLCVVCRLDESMGSQCVQDKELGLFRIRTRRLLSQRYEIVFAQSIVRGALVASDQKRPKDFLVVDLVDSDMFLCCQKIFSV